jgi:hypothetical protein
MRIRASSLLHHDPAWKRFGGLESSVVQLQKACNLHQDILNDAT